MIVTIVLIERLVILSIIVGLVSWGISDMRVVGYKRREDRLKRKIRSLEIIIKKENL